MAKKKQPTLEELNVEISTMETNLRDMQTWSYRYSFGESMLRGDIQRLKDKRDSLYPPPPPEVSTRLRVWRGQRGVRVVVPVLSAALGCDVSIGVFCSIEGGRLERVEPELVSKIEQFLNQG